MNLLRASTRRGLGTFWPVALLVVLLALGGCNKADDPAPAPAAATPGSGKPLRVLAGSELKDVETSLKADIAAATGVDLAFTYSGTLDAIERLAAGEQFDAVWVSHGKYLAMNDALKGRIRASEKTMLSPVVLGVKASKARQLGWDQGEPTWKDIADAAKAGRFTFAMTNPTSSNTGLTAVIGLASALARSPDALTGADLKNPRLADFFRGQSLTSGSSGWLAEAFVRDQAKVDGIINYESVLLSLNAGGALAEPLVLVYPKEGIVTADYPLMLLEDGRRAEYDRLVAYLRSTPFQSRMSAATLRRPINPDATSAAAIPQRTLIELPFPGSADVVDELLGNFLADTRVPATTRYVLDISGSDAWPAPGVDEGGDGDAGVRQRHRSGALRPLPEPRGDRHHRVLVVAETDPAFQDGHHANRERRDPRRGPGLFAEPGRRRRHRHLLERPAGARRAPPRRAPGRPRSATTRWS